MAARRPHHHPPASGPRLHRAQIRDRGYPPSVREIGEASASRRRRRCTATSTRSAPRLPAPRPDQAAGDRGALGPQLRRGDGAPAGPPRARSSATSPPAPTCWPRRTSRSCCPVPADFTGEGELFMLRVRGDSMIEAGILDGDFVVAVQQTNGATTATSSSPASPAARRRSRLQPTADGVTLTPANSTMEPMVFDAERRRDLRPGRHRDAPALTVQPALGRSVTHRRRARRAATSSIRSSGCTTATRTNDRHRRTVELARADERTALARPAARRTPSRRRPANHR